eukprot:gnl/MRDRNA2_/MRDRNA2_82683_c0_seq1.p2 gnl/MRDRNA2_/MRDRNA2_82683_c0~~gnl/MRDRNA2_/MRDRNA2_82683_c0_seq1.p2  ORF type:complete len:128 (+),score=2.80 gnl/MRDRNA2_/MRDRNA2_82683_c0_seq1:72-455(+)
MYGQTSPTRADLQQMITRFQIEIPADAVQLIQRGFLHGVGLLFEDAAGIAHGIVQKEAVKIVPQIVVCMNVAGRAEACIPSEPVPEPGGTLSEPGHAPFKAIGDFQVADEDPHQCRQIMTGPVTVDQ